MESEKKVTIGSKVSESEKKRISSFVDSVYSEGSTSQNLRKFFLELLDKKWVRALPQTSRFGNIKNSCRMCGSIDIRQFENDVGLIEGECLDIRCGCKWLIERGKTK